MSKIDYAWHQLIEKYDIIEEIKENGKFVITAEQIREFEEPRLMVNFDNSNARPKILKKTGITILPLSRKEYALGRFELYQDFPPTKLNYKEIIHVPVPETLETISIHNMKSESAIINAIKSHGILQHFLNEPALFTTVSGRFGSGSFILMVATDEEQAVLEINNAQIEIDGGFECENSLIIVEAKNAAREDFQIRQLYYPLRRWRTRTKKPIRTVLANYDNGIFRLIEYRFENLYDYNSMTPVKEAFYSFEDFNISLDEIRQVWETAPVGTDREISFANVTNLEKVITLMEHLVRHPLTEEAIADLFDVKRRQADYYYNACAYLGLAKRKKYRTPEGTVNKTCTTTLGRRIMKMPYKDRQLAICQQMFKHPIFHDLFEAYLSTGKIPTKKSIAAQMPSWHPGSPSLTTRRASVAHAWLTWLTTLISQEPQA